MEKISKKDFFKEYKVYDYQNDIFCGIITGVDVSVAKIICDNDILAIEVTIHLLVDVNNKPVKKSKTFKNIYFTGRNCFQEFADIFGLFLIDDNNDSIVELNKLLGKYCEITLCGKNVIESILPAVWADEESEKNSRDFFKDVQVDNAVKVDDKVHSSFEYFANNGNIFYTFIPFNGSFGAKLLNRTDYIGYIDCVECNKDKYKPGDVIVSLSVYVFNGGCICKKYKYFNQVKSSGKRKFGKFCNELSIVNSTGTISPDDITGRFCSIRLDEDGKYIDEIIPETIKGIADKKQYMDIIQRMESVNEKKAQIRNWENSANNLRLRKTGSVTRNKNIK